MSARYKALAIAALGMTVPVLVGLAAGRPELGFTIGLGAMLLAGTEGGASADRASPETAIAPATLAVLCATLISGAKWTDAATIAAVGAATAVSGYSRPIGVAAIRFAIYLVLSVSLLDGAGDHRTGAALIFGLGALWNVAIRLLLAGTGTGAAAAAPAGSRNPTPQQRRAHWRRTMRALAGWQFTVRMVVGLAIASAVRHAFPAHHYFWILLTVALLTQRQLEPLPVKLVERAGGTALGVALTWLIILARLPVVPLALLVCLLGTAAPLARARSYALYASLSTPVILLVMDWGKPVATGLLTDRIVATLIAALIVILGNLAFERLLQPGKTATPAG